jgi:NAD(P)-dependent dehydrogenase (short-subunit alcohol dehydrogenase family)
VSQYFQGKAAVITGSGDGIGREVALLMASEGAQVVVNDINREAGDKVVAEIKQAGGKALANYDSVATLKGGAAIVNTAISNFGRVDILVNCAGNFKSVGIDISEEDWDFIITVHLKGHFACCKAAVPEMIKQKSGRIINISSRAAAFGRVLAYGTAKAGILGFTSMLAAEVQEHGITVNAILPSAQTKLFPGGAPKTIDKMPIPPERTPDFIAPVIAYLATDEARYITGRYIYSSGGDVCIYGRPFRLNAEANVLIRSRKKWTIDELSEVLTPLIGEA